MKTRNWAKFLLGIAFLGWPVFGIGGDRSGESPSTFHDRDRSTESVNWHGRLHCLGKCEGGDCELKFVREKDGEVYDVEGGKALADTLCGNKDISHLRIEGELSPGGLFSSPSVRVSRFQRVPETIAE